MISDTKRRMNCKINPISFDKGQYQENSDIVSKFLSHNFDLLQSSDVKKKIWLVRPIQNVDFIIL